jgi:hypothetical protein
VNEAASLTGNVRSTFRRNKCLHHNIERASMTQPNHGDPLVDYWSDRMRSSNSLTSTANDVGRSKADRFVRPVALRNRRASHQ